MAAMVFGEGGADTVVGDFCVIFHNMVISLK